MISVRTQWLKLPYLPLPGAWTPSQIANSEQMATVLCLKLCFLANTGLHFHHGHGCS